MRVPRHSDAGRACLTQTHSERPSLRQIPASQTIYSIDSVELTGRSAFHWHSLGGCITITVFPQQAPSSLLEHPRVLQCLLQAVGVRISMQKQLSLRDLLSDGVGGISSPWLWSQVGLGALC